jgi:class 3 adenylate cyclase
MSTVERRLAAVLDAERRGEVLTALDLADRGLEEHPDSLWLQHRAVLALARAGATEQAAQRFDDYGLVSEEATHEDIASLRARIAKDGALAARDPVVRQREAAGAADAYAAVFKRTGGYYPAVNAATMSLLSGDSKRASELARQVLALVHSDDETSYYAAAIEAEAQLLLGDVVAARAALARAAGLHGGDYGAVSTTRRQLRLLCELRGIDEEVLTALQGPTVAHFCGHRIAAAGEAGRFRAENEPAVAERIRQEVARQPTTFAYGALANGGDVLWAEALVDSGTELHVVLPFERQEFLEASVAPAGDQWVARFERLLYAATSVTYATEDAHLGDDVLYRYGSELAMGLAILRGRYLEANLRQFALWDGTPANGTAGTAIDVATWRLLGLPSTVVTPDGRPVSQIPSIDEPRSVDGSSSGRKICAMLFADVKGFSKLTDDQLPRFAEHVLGALATVVERHAEHVLHRNTWGDALYVVLDDVGLAAECGLELQEAMAAIDLEASGLPSHLALWLGAHVGPVFPILDPALGLPAYMGSHVSRTARIEPVTPPGAVYVTEPFAAALVLSGSERLACDYVGHMPAAKDYGRLRMYRLRRT